MRKYLLAAFLVHFASFTFAQKDVYLFSYFIKNGEDGLHLAYSYDGLTWSALNNGKSFLSPQLGKDKLMRDPSITIGRDGTFHLVWTTGWWEKTIGYAHSKDLIEWSKQRTIPAMEHEPTAKNAWAPDLFFDRRSNLYYIVWASTIPDRHSEVAESKSEKGLNHRQYYTTTKDFQTFSPSTIFFNPDFSVIDATIVHWKGFYRMIVKNENPNPPQKNLRVTTAKLIEGGFPTNVSAPITGSYWAEGPTAIAIGNYLYVYFDKYTEGKYGAIRTRDGEHWEDVSEQISFPQGTRHGTAFKVSRPFFDNLRKCIIP